MLDHKETSHNNRVITLEKTVMELFEFKVRSEAQIKSLHKEVNSLKQHPENAKPKKLFTFQQKTNSDKNF